jgi:uracil-DNA glycosylase
VDERVTGAAVGVQAYPADNVVQFRLMTMPLSVESITVQRSRMAEIEALHARIVACRSCETGGYVGAARPIRHAWTDRQRTMIVGQAPGAQTEAKRFHFAGPGGILLGKWLVAAGYDADHWREQCYVTSLTRCFPGKAPNGKGDRRPSPSELTLCRPFLDEELRLVQPRVVLAIGTMAIERFLGRVSLSAVVGTTAAIDGRLVVPLPHPSGVSRWLNDPEHQALVERALQLLHDAREDLDL